MSNPILALIPSGYKASRVYSVLPNDNSGNFTFARATTATRVRKDGLIETVATTVPRLNWLNSDCPSLLIEASAINSQQYSELSTGKSLTGATLTDNNSIAPTGEKKAMELKEDTNNSRHRFYVGGVLSTTSGTQYTLSLFVKKQSENRFIFINGGAFMGVSGSFNLDTQAVTGNVQLFETYPNGWYRIGITATANATHTSGYFVQLQQGTTDADYTGDGSSVLVWGLQFEESGLSSYIANLSNGSTTRNKDVCVVNPPSDVVKITETFADDTTNVITTIPVNGELVTNGDFATDSDWTKGTGWSIAGGVAVAVAGSASYLNQNIGGQSGKKYMVKIDVVITAGTVFVFFGQFGGTFVSITSSGSYTFINDWTSNSNIGIYKDASFVGLVDNVSVKEVYQINNGRIKKVIMI